MPRPVIALLTDFGLRDHYTGTMKGVMAGICPDAQFIDITHDIPAHDVLAGALELAASFHYFPAGSVFLAVVDPGVGSARRGIAVETADYRFVAPDNGVLTLALERAAPKKIVELTARKFARPSVSRTFEGRDRFAPAAAWLAKGIELPALGRSLADCERLVLPALHVSEGGVAGEVVRVDRFGNLISNIDRRTFERLGPRVDVRVGPVAVSRLVSTYADTAPGEVCALFGSSDHLEIAVNGGSAAERLALARGAVVQVTRRA